MEPWPELSLGAVDSPEEAGGAPSPAGEAEDAPPDEEASGLGLAASPDEPEAVGVDGAPVPGASGAGGAPSSRPASASGPSEAFFLGSDWDCGCPPFFGA
ncbi:protein of unknown function [Methylacidimicrobium sp. AP8]|nr:protein of unknown function [Methylacidimicrobium sp. AP8]